MDLTPASVIGILASIGSMSSFVPQAVRIVRTRDTKGLSRNMYVLTVVTFALWAAYGVALGNWAIGVTNVVCFVLSTFILVMLVLPASKKRKLAAKLDPTSKDG